MFCVMHDVVDNRFNYFTVFFQGYGLTAGLLFIRAGRTYEKIPCYMRESICRWFVFEKANTFWSNVKHFLTLVGLCTAWKVPKYGVFSGPYSVRLRENTDQKELRIRTLFTQCADKLSWIAQPYFSRDIIKQSSYHLLFLAFKTFNEKHKVSYKVLLL